MSNRIFLAVRLERDKEPVILNEFRKSLCRGSRSLFVYGDEEELPPESFPLDIQQSY